MSPDEQRDARALIGELQTVLARQHLATDIYNDSVAAAAHTRGQVPEGHTHPALAFEDPALVREILLPALELKQRILDAAVSGHEAARPPDRATLTKPYEDFTRLLHAMQERTRVQHAGAAAWLEQPSAPVDVTGLDELEEAMLATALGSLSALIETAGIEADDLLELERAAFNDVRRSIDLPELSPQEFGAIFVARAGGQPARFFD